MGQAAERLGAELVAHLVRVAQVVQVAAQRLVRLLGVVELVAVHFGVVQEGTQGASVLLEGAVADGVNQQSNT